MPVPRLPRRRRTPPDRREESEMTRERILTLGAAFAAFLRLFAGCFVQQRSRDHLLAYCRGLLSDLPRKSVEPIALKAGIAVRTLQVFLKDALWDQSRLRDLL